MALPGITNKILDGGLGITSPASSIPHVIGVFESGPLNVPQTIANPRVLNEQYGTHGPGNDCAGVILAGAGGPIVCTRVTSNVAASYGATNLATLSVVASVGGGADNAVNFQVATSAPKNDFRVILQITVGGTRTLTKFKFSLDGGLTFSPETSAAASVPLGTSGVTAEFGVGTVAAYTAASTYTVQANAPSFDSTNLALAFTAAEQSLLVWDYFILAGDFPTSVAGALIHATVETEMNKFVTVFDKYFGCYLNGGREVSPATAITSYASTTGLRTGKAFGNYVAPAPFPVPGRGFMGASPVVHAVGLRAAGNVISTDLSATSGAASVGAIPGVQSISQNEYLNNAGLDTAKFATMRTFPNNAGFFLTNVPMGSPVGSDFEFWQHRRIMDQACRVVSAQHTLLLSQAFPVKGDGTGSLTEDAAQSIEKRVQRALDNTIGSAIRGVGPTRLDGKIGHVSDVGYQVDRTNNVLVTKTVQATVSIIPLGYGKFFTTTLSFKLSLA